MACLWFGCGFTHAGKSRPPKVGRPHRGDRSTVKAARRARRRTR